MFLSFFKIFMAMRKKMSKKSCGRTPQTRAHISTPETPEKLEHYPNKEKQIFSVTKKEKPNFDLSFLNKSENKYTNLLTNVSSFLDNVPGSSNASGVSASSTMTGDSGFGTASSSALKKPENFQEIENSWKLATRELACSDSDESDNEESQENEKEQSDIMKAAEAIKRRNIEIQMALCPFSKIPKALLPNVSDSSDDDSSEDDRGDMIVEMK